jgi:hypothetical protein
VSACMSVESRVKKKNVYISGLKSIKLKILDWN